MDEVARVRVRAFYVAFHALFTIRPLIHRELDGWICFQKIGGERAPNAGWLN